ncbi:MAG: peptidylprolyl isomerase [Candidatus Nanopelagicales bacterium]
MSPQVKPGEGESNKRRKELARAKSARQEAARLQREAQARQRRLMAAGIAALLVVIGGLTFAFWPRGGDSTAAEPSDSVSELAPTAVAGCTQAPTGVESPKSWDKAPADRLSAAKYTLTLTTNCGDIDIATKPKAAAKNVNSMLWLAQEGFFDNTLCHRLTTESIYVLQCGDPTATGSGGPGYKLPDENLPKEGAHNYPAGTVAMANSGANTAGSQFFLVYQDTTLPAGYTIWGEITKGLDIVKKVAAAGVIDSGTDGGPNQPIGILSATVTPKLQS